MYSSLQHSDHHLVTNGRLNLHRACTGGAARLCLLASLCLPLFCWGQGVLGCLVWVRFLWGACCLSLTKVMKAFSMSSILVKVPRLSSVLAKRSAFLRNSLNCSWIDSFFCIHKWSRFKAIDWWSSMTTLLFSLMFWSFKLDILKQLWHSVLEWIWIKGSYLSQWLPQGGKWPP